MYQIIKKYSPKSSSYELKNPSRRLANVIFTISKTAFSNSYHTLLLLGKNFAFILKHFLRVPQNYKHENLQVIDLYWIFGLKELI